MMTPTAISPKSEAERMRTVLRLVRVSGDAQDTGRQYDETDGTAQELNLRIIRTLELQGVSGTTVLNNEEVRKLMREMQDSQVDGLLLSAFDRYFRPKNFEQMQHVQQLADIGKPIYTTREGEIDPTSDSGWESLMTLSTRAGVELREMRRRSISGKLKNARNGFINSGSAPYGYDHVFADKRTRSRAAWIINEREAEVVRRIFAWAVQERLGVYAIAKRLNIEGIPSKRAGQLHSKKTGKMNSGKWSQRVVHQLLTNPVYTGTFEIFHRGMPDAIKGHCPPIIEEDIFQIVQLELKGNGGGQKTGKTSRKYSLSGLGYCLLCGHRLTTFPRPFPKAYYRCGHIDRRPPMKRLCDAPCIDKTLLETTVLSAVLNAVADDVTLSRMIETAYTDDQGIDNTAGRIQEAETSLHFLQQAEEHAYKNVQDPRLPRERSIGDWELAKQARQDAEFSLSRLQKNQPRPVPSETTVAAIARELANYKPETLEEQKAFLRLLVSEFRTNGSDLTIEVAIPETLLSNASDGGKQKGNTTSVRGIGPYQMSCPPFVRPTLNSPISFTINTKIVKSA